MRGERIGRELGREKMILIRTVRVMTYAPTPENRRFCERKGSPDRLGYHLLNTFLGAAGDAHMNVCSYVHTL